jgi:DNA-binding transcriptional LysR family regulator
MAHRSQFLTAPNWSGHWGRPDAPSKGSAPPPLTPPGHAGLAMCSKSDVPLVLAPRLPELTTRYPQLSLELLVSNHREDMMAGGVDLALRFGPPSPSALIARKILETRIITCASPSYLARRGTPKVPKDIVNHEALLFRDPQSGRPFTWEFRRRENVVEIPVDGRIVMDDPSAALAACETGQGLFQSFELGLAQWLASGKLVQVLPEWSDERFPLYAYYPSRRQAPAKLRAFLEFVLIAANA